MAGIDLDMNTTDPVELAAAFEQLSSGDTTAKEPEAPKDEQSKEDPGQKEPQKAEPEPAGLEGEPQGVATKDGKHVIPYSVLKGERDRATRAEQLANEMREKLESLEAQVKQGSQGAKDGEGARTEQTPDVSDLSSEDLEALKEDFPTVYKGLKAMEAKAAALEKQLQTVNASVQERDAQSERSAAESVQDAIDSVPKMAHIQANDAAAFDLAKQFDATLRAQPAWATKTLAERFSKVTEMVEAALGPIELPGGKPTSPQKSAEDLKAEAKAKAEASAKAKGSGVPTSLSEFPAGQHAAQDEREAVEGQSVLQLAERFGSMTPDQMDAYFRNL